MILRLLLLWLVMATACREQQRWPDEATERLWWNEHFRLQDGWIERDRSVGPILSAMDSLERQAGGPTAMSRALRHEVVAQFHYFAGKGDSTAALSVDSALRCFPDEQLQQRYPNMYLGLLLFAGNLAFRQHQFERARESFFRARELSARFVPPCTQSAYSYNLGIVLYRQQNYRQSALHFREAFQRQSECAVVTRSVALQQQEILSNIGLCFLQLGREDSAISYFDAAERYTLQHRDTLGPLNLDKIRGVLAGNRAKIYLKRGDWQRAEALLRQGISLNARPGYETAFAQEVRLDLARLYHKTSRFSEVRQQLDALRADLDTLPQPSVDIGWHQLMADLARSGGDATSELRHFRRLDALSDSLSEVRAHLRNADMLRQMGEKELQLRVRLLEAQSRRDARSLWLLSIAIALVVLLMLIIYRSDRRNRRNLTAVTALNKKISQQQELLRQETERRQQLVMEAVIRAQEAERSAIGLELHDNINQVLTTVKLHTEMVADGIGDAKVVLPRASGYLQQCINEIRSLSKRLSAPTLGKIGLRDSVSELVESINLTGKISISLDSTQLPATPIRREVHLAIYRIIQEALNNTLKHSGATAARVVLTIDDNQQLTLHFSDNGSGYVRNREGSGIGITNMRSRAESLGGSFLISNSGNGGCCIDVAIPDAVATQPVCT